MNNPVAQPNPMKKYFLITLAFNYLYAKLKEIIHTTKIFRLY